MFPARHVEMNDVEVKKLRKHLPESDDGWHQPQGRVQSQGQLGSSSARPTQDSSGFIRSSVTNCSSTTLYLARELGARRNLELEVPSSRTTTAMHPACDTRLASVTGR